MSTPRKRKRLDDVGEDVALMSGNGLHSSSSHSSSDKPEAVPLHESTPKKRALKTQTDSEGQLLHQYSTGLPPADSPTLPYTDATPGKNKVRSSHRTTGPGFITSSPMNKKSAKAQPSSSQGVPSSKTSRRLSDEFQDLARDSTSTPPSSDSKATTAPSIILTTPEGEEARSPIYSADQKQSENSHLDDPTPQGALTPHQHQPEHHASLNNPHGDQVDESNTSIMDAIFSPGLRSFVTQKFHALTSSLGVRPASDVETNLNTSQDSSTSSWASNHNEAAAKIRLPVANGVHHAAYRRKPHHGLSAPLNRSLSSSTDAINDESVQTSPLLSAQTPGLLTSSQTIDQALFPSSGAEDVSPESSSRTSTTQSEKTTDAHALIAHKTTTTTTTTTATTTDIEGADQSVLVSATKAEKPRAPIHLAEPTEKNGPNGFPIHPNSISSFISSNKPFGDATAGKIPESEEPADWKIEISESGEMVFTPLEQVISEDEASTLEGTEEVSEEEFDSYLFMATVPPLNSLITTPTPPPGLPLKHRHAPKVTLVLDLDETLVHCSLEKIDNPDLIFAVPFDGEEYQVYVRKRPGFEEFLTRVSELFEVAVFTASQKAYADKLLNILDPTRKWIHHRLFRESCVFVLGNYLKDLNVLGRELSKVIIVDNSPHVFAYQLDNGVPIESWYNDSRDRELLHLVPFLETLASCSDVRPIIRSKFQLYKKVEESFRAYNQITTKIQEVSTSASSSPEKTASKRRAAFNSPKKGKHQSTSSAVIEGDTDSESEAPPKPSRHKARVRSRLQIYHADSDDSDTYTLPAKRSRRK